MRKPKKFDLVHQTVSPRKRVGSGDETKVFLGWSHVRKQWIPSHFSPCFVSGLDTRLDIHVDLILIGQGMRLEGTLPCDRMVGPK